MKKIVIHKPGDYSVLKIEEFPDPVPAENEVLIKVHYVGVNYADIVVRWGLYKSAKDFVGWPITPGFEVSGVVEKVGRAISKFRPGDLVFGVTRFGGYTSHLCVTEDLVFPLPKNLSLEQAAGFPAVYLTAYHALFQNIVIPPKAKILIHSAGGGVGSALVQLAKWKGCEVTGIVGSSHKVDFVKSLGADYVIDKSSQDLWEEVEKISGTGFDIIADANGAETLKYSYKHLASSGKLLVYGFHTMMPKQGGKVDWIKLIRMYLKTPRFNPLDMTSDNKSVIAFNLSYLFEKKELFIEATHHLISLIESGNIKGPSTTVYDFVRVSEAHKALESGKTTGKIILSLK